MFAGLAEGLPATIDLELQGEIGEVGSLLAKLSFLKGLLGNIGGDPVSYVNAARLAEQRSSTFESSPRPARKVAQPDPGHR